jgi:glycosyltransferase involved in cell wall biosynthesis
MNNKKKVLIISYYWPPAGGPGVQRVLKFAKYLPEFGWEPIVLTVKNGEYPAMDSSLIKEIPNECRVYSTKTIEFFTLFKFLTGRKRRQPIETFILNRKATKFPEKVFTWVRQNLFIPDARIGWIPFATKKGIEIIKEEKPAIIFSSSPPHSIHLTAFKLAQRFNIPWVADFRDPWTDAFWDKGLGRMHAFSKRNLALEKKVIAAANALVTVSPGYREILMKEPREDFFVLTNGFDHSDFIFKKQSSSKFRIVYTGNIAASQNPLNFFQAIQTLKGELGEVLDIHLYGNADVEVHEAVEALGIADLINFHPYIPHDEAIEKMTNSDLLLLLQPKIHGDGMIPGKAFEYIATKNPILGIGDVNGDSANLLRECRVGEMYGYEESLVDPLREIIEFWQNGNIPQADLAAIENYDRKSLTKRLAKIFDHYGS